MENPSNHIPENTLEETAPKEMSFIDHLEELRWHLIRSIVAILIFSIAAFLAKNFIFDSLIFGPKKESFITYTGFCNLSGILNLGDRLCLTPTPFTLQSLSPPDQFLMHIKVALMIGFVIAFPYSLWELWRFIKPGLYENEIKHTRGIVFWGSLLFFLGVSFGYFILAPFSINFFANYSISPEVTNQFSISSFISVITTVVMAAGIMFELPMIVYLLSKIGIVSPDMMRNHRKHAFVIILVIAAVITPADVWTQILVTIPVYFLYEISVFISARVYKEVV